MVIFFGRTVVFKSIKRLLFDILFAGFPWKKIWTNILDSEALVKSGLTAGLGARVLHASGAQQRRAAEEIVNTET